MLPRKGCIGNQQVNKSTSVSADQTLNHLFIRNSTLHPHVHFQLRVTVKLHDKRKYVHLCVFVHVLQKGLT